MLGTASRVYFETATMRSLVAGRVFWGDGGRWSRRGFGEDRPRWAVERFHGGRNGGDDGSHAVRSGETAGATSRNGGGDGGDDAVAVPAMTTVSEDGWRSRSIAGCAEAARTAG